MSHVMAFVYDDQFKGEEARAALHRMAGDGLLEMNDSVFITRRPDGKTSVSQEDTVMGRDQKIGQIAGLIAAAVTGTVPFVLAGTLAGRLVGKLTDDGITRKFIRDLKKELQPGTSGLLVLGSTDPQRRRKIQERMQGFGGRILESDLPPELQEEIESEIQRQKAAQSTTPESLSETRGAKTMKETIGNFLLRRLEEVGIRHVFGVPGDFNLEFVQQLEDRGRPEWVGNCNELNASYAADGYARLNGPAALVVTNGVGALSAINGIAGSYSEHLPIVCICGSLPLRSIARRTLMHHTLADGSQDVFLRAYRQVTAAQAQLTPQNATEEIDRLIRTAWRVKRPVYLELPSDIAYLEIQVPDEPLVLREPESDEERLTSCVRHIVGRLSSARRPAVLIDMDAQRFGLLQEVNELTEKLQLPVATMSSSKGIFSEQSPLFAGIYFGSASSQQLRDLVEGSDCLIAIGHRRVDSTSDFFTDRLPDSVIRLEAYSADVSNEYYEGITLRAVLRQVIDSVPARQAEPARHRSAANTVLEISDTALTQAEFWGALQNFVRPGDVIIAEDGTSSSGGSKLVLPEGCTFITQAIWGSIGYTLGALLGTLKAAPERRHILLIGDGSFQLTAQELSTILRHDLKPLIFLINNSGYTIERTILGLHAKYNDVANWNYADLPRVFSRRQVASHVVATSKELSEVLRAVDDSFVFIELLMKPEDAPLGLIRGGHESANLDYGPRGPQSAPGAQIPVPQA